MYDIELCCNAMWLSPFCKVQYTLMCEIGYADILSHIKGVCGTNSGCNSNPKQGWNVDWENGISGGTIHCHKIGNIAQFSNHTHKGKLIGFDIVNWSYSVL